MNRVLQLLMAATLMTGFAACSSDDDMTNNFPEDGVVRFNVGVNNPQTRASQPTDGSKVAEFGICIANSVNSTYTYNNVKVTGSNITAWTPATQMLWQNSTQAVDIVAYSPYVEGDYNISTTNLPVKVEETQIKDGYTSDFLICKKPGFVPSKGLSEGGKLNLAFKHALSQLTITVTLGSEFNAPDLVTTNPITDLKSTVHTLKVYATLPRNQASSQPRLQKPIPLPLLRLSMANLKSYLSIIQCKGNLPVSADTSEHRERNIQRKL